MVFAAGFLTNLGATPVNTFPSFANLTKCCAMDKEFVFRSACALVLMT